MALPVTDLSSNRNDNIENAANAIGGSRLRQQVFSEIHHGKRKIKTVAFIAGQTGLTRQQVLNAAGPLVRKGLVGQTKHDSDTGYEKSDFLQQHKPEILRLARDKKKLAEYPTKTSRAPSTTLTLRIPSSGGSADPITVDEIGSFKKVRGLSPADDRLPKTLSEQSFKDGIKKILGEPGEFKDWGGEKNDLTTTRLIVAGRRRPAAFAFKGPGLDRKLTPKFMGKNGDQIQRLFLTASDVFLVQHRREIDTDAVLELMRAFASLNASMTGRKTWYATIDGADSRRIYDAYPEAFSGQG